MKRILVILFAAVLLLCSCGEKAPGIDGKSISQPFLDTYTINLTVPNGWNYLVISDSDMFELQHNGIQLFDSEIPEHPEMYDGKLYVAKAASGFAKTYVDTWIEMGKDFTEEAHTTKSGLAMKLYYVDGLPEYATFDDYSALCVFFDLDKDDDLDMIFAILDSVKLEKAE